MITTQLAPGTELGRYELLMPIAKGGMAQVWAARLHGIHGFKKLVAIKTILPGGMDDTRLEQMFLEEASLAAQIHHPNVVETLELGEEDGTLYLVMEWVEGEPLSLVLNRATQRGGMPIPLAVRVLAQACKGLHAAHDLRSDTGELLGLVHRDISPQNILVTYGGTAKLVDFGIAKATGRSGGLTEAGELKGKVAFMAPEQLLGQPLDRRTDVFALGIVLFNFTTGHHPFKGDHPAETIRRICSNDPIGRPSALVPGFPFALEGVIMKALSREPKDRWSSADHLRIALECAVPEGFDSNAEAKLAAYLDDLVGERARERRSALRLAQENVERSKTHSCGSLRAITLDSFPDVESPSGRSLRLVPEPLSERALPPTLPAPPVRKSRWASLALMAAGALTAGALYSMRVSQVAAPASSPVVASAPALAAAAPEEAHEPAASTSAAPLPSDSAGSVSPRRSVSKTKEQRKSRAPEPSASTASSGRAPQVKSTTGSAWDPASFGGRH